MKKPLKKIAVGAMFAAAVGYIAGVLTAPKSGKETREELKTAANQTWAEGERKLKKLHTELTGLIDEFKTRKESVKDQAQKHHKQVLAEAEKAREKARAVLSAIHEGETEDKDLQKAIAEAKKAINHLREYYQK
jgi:gas vesicle protein